MRSKSSVTTASVSSVRSVDSVVIISRHLSRSSSVKTCIRIPVNQLVIFNNKSSASARRSGRITEAVSDDSSGAGLRTRMRTSQLVVRRMLDADSMRWSSWKMLLCGCSDPASDQSVTSLNVRAGAGAGGYWRMLTSHSGCAGRGRAAGCCESVWDAPSQSVYSLGSRGGYTGGYCRILTSQSGGAAPTTSAVKTTTSIYSFKFNLITFNYVNRWCWMLHPSWCCRSESAADKPADIDGFSHPNPAEAPQLPL